MKIYTKNGDKGKTTLFDGTSLHKDDDYFEFLGTVDELTSQLGLAKAHISNETLKGEIHKHQQAFIQLMGEVAKYEQSKGYINQDLIKSLEEAIDCYTAKMPANDQFLCPGDHVASAHFHVARTICRRAERRLYSLENKGARITATIKSFINRFSDYLFTLARYVDFVENIEELVKKEMQGRQKQQLPKAHILNLNKAVHIMKQVEAEAARMGLDVVIAIANEAGHIMAIHSMDGALIASFELAMNKAFTSVAVKMSTEALGEVSAPGQSLYGIQFSHGGKIVNFGGGELLKKSDTIIGAIGVSGGSADEDVALARFGAKLINE